LTFLCKIWKPSLFQSSNLVLYNPIKEAGKMNRAKSTLRKGRAKGVITPSGLICQYEEQGKRRNKGSSKKNMAGQMKKTNRVVLPTWKYWYRK